MRFRYSIRDLFWLTLVVALAVSWWQARRSFVDLEKRYEDLKTHHPIEWAALEKSYEVCVAEIDRLKAKVKKLGGTVEN